MMGVVGRPVGFFDLWLNVNPKSGTVTFDVTKAIEDIKAVKWSIELIKRHSTRSYW